MEFFEHIRGTSHRRCTCPGGWLGHYRIISGSRRTTCSVLFCGGAAEVGAHIRSRGRDRRHYIVPTCDWCNSDRGGLFELKSGVVLVTANISVCTTYDRRPYY